MIFINPRKTSGVAFAEERGGLHLWINPGTDTPLQMALARVILENGWEDREWIDKYTNNKWETDSGFGQGTRNTDWQWRTTWGQIETKGFEDYKAWILAQKESEVDFAAELCGIDADDIVYAAELMAKPRADGTRPKTSLALEKGNYWPAAARRGVQCYTEEPLESARETRRAETLHGRVRTLPDINSRNYTAQENAKRMAINTRIQGTAADLLKLAMIAVDRRLRRELPQARLLLTAHDELVLEAPESDVERVSAVAREEMEGVAELRVPLVVDAASGKEWYEAKA